MWLGEGGSCSHFGRFEAIPASKNSRASAFKGPSMADRLV